MRTNLRLVFGSLIVGLACFINASTFAAQDWDVIFSTDWQSGIDPRFGIQADTGDVSVVSDPAGKYAAVLQAAIRRSENFTGVANGVPRAELLFPAPVRFAQGRAYRINWSTNLPVGTRFDSRQLVIITQINQGTWLGGPTVALALQGDRYAISQHGGIHHDKVSAGAWLGRADADIGKWVQWELIYQPADNGSGALTQLQRNGKTVFRVTDIPNAYPGVQNAYLKIGIYKPEWQKKATDVDQISVLYGPVKVSRR